METNGNAVFEELIGSLGQYDADLDKSTRKEAVRIERRFSGFLEEYDDDAE